MSTTRGYNLAWDPQDRTSTLLESLSRTGDGYADVTLVSQDGNVFQAHRVILACSSSFFDTVIKNSFCDIGKLVVCLSETGGENLGRILEFIYKGQTAVKAEDLDEFTKMAKKLKIRGLTQNEEALNEDNNEEENSDISKKTASNNSNPKKGVDNITSKTANPKKGDDNINPKTTNSKKVDENITYIEHPIKEEVEESLLDEHFEENNEEEEEINEIEEAPKEPAIIEYGDNTCPYGDFNKGKGRGSNVLVQHLMKIHGQSSKLKCNKCEFLCEEAQLMITHKRSHKYKPKGNRLECSLCDYKTLIQVNLERHMKYFVHPNSSSNNSEYKSVDEASTTDIDLD